MFTGVKYSIALLTVALLGVMVQEASALTTEVALQPTRNPVTNAPTASLSVIANDVPRDCTRMTVFSQTRVRNRRPSIETVASVPVRTERNNGKITIRFRYLPTNSSGVTEKVAFQVTCSNSAGDKTVSQSNGGTLNQCDNKRVVRGLAAQVNATTPVVIY